MDYSGELSLPYTYECICMWSLFSVLSSKSTSCIINHNNGTIPFDKTLFDALLDHVTNEVSSIANVGITIDDIVYDDEDWTTKKRTSAKCVNWLRTILTYI